VSTVDTDGRHCHVCRATTRCTSTVITFAGKAGRTWVTRDRVGVAYNRHDALKNEAAYARQYKYMATTPLLQYTHLPLAESRTTYSTD